MGTRAEAKGDAKILSNIRESYSQRVEPIVKQSCMDCHSSQTRYPWYYKVPGLKQAIDAVINEARRHFDMSEGYPFKSHASAIEDLDAIRDSIQRGSMPPFGYQLFHPEARLSNEQKKTIVEWIERSKHFLVND